MGNAWQIKIKLWLYVFLQRENVNCFLLLLIGWSQFPHLTNEKVDTIRVSTRGSYLSLCRFLCRNMRGKNYQVLTKLPLFGGKNPYGPQRPLCPVDGFPPPQGHALASSIFVAQVWVMRFTWGRDLWGDSSPDKWISHNSQEGTAQLERNKQSQIVPYLEWRAKSS